MNPLQNKKLLITRAEHQTDSFIKLLENKGAETISLPMIAIRAIENQENIIKELTQLEDVDWLVFTSVNTVNYFFEAIEKYQIKVHFLTHLRIATVGEKTKAALEKVGYRSSFVPIEYTAEMLAKQIPIFGDERILIPQSSKANNEYVNLLSQQCKEVITLPIYENYNPTYSKTEIESVLASQVDWITFFSGSAVENFCQHLSKYHLELSHEKIAVIGSSTEKVAVNNGLKINLVAEPYTAEGMLNELLKFYRHE